jgi:hypothetical protein
MPISLLSEALDIEDYAVGVVELRVRVGVVDRAIRGFGKGVRCQGFRVMGKLNDRTMTGHCGRV